MNLVHNIPFTAVRNLRDFFFSLDSRSVSRDVRVVLSVYYYIDSHRIFNHYWMRLSGISRIIEAEVGVICPSRRLRQITLTTMPQ